MQLLLQGEGTHAHSIAVLTADICTHLLREDPVISCTACNCTYTVFRLTSLIIDDDNGQAEVAVISGIGGIGRLGLPGAGDDLMAGGLGRLGSHPEPDAGHEAQLAVLLDEIRIVEQLGAVTKENIGAQTVVVVIGQLDGATAMIALAGHRQIAGAAAPSSCLTTITTVCAPMFSSVTAPSFSTILISLSRTASWAL